MDFDYFLQHSEYDTQKDIVGLAIYFNEEYNEMDEVPYSAINGIIQSSRTEVPPGNVSTYCGRLQDDDLLTTGQEGGYRLSYDGWDHFNSLVDSELTVEPRENRFIDTDITDHQFYNNLVEDINKSYRYRINDATLVLTRKLLENLLIDVLRSEYGGQQVELYFNTDHRRFHGFGKLKSNFEENYQDLEPYCRTSEDNWLEGLEQFRVEGNSSAHSILVGLSDEDIEEMADEATHLTEILYDCWANIQ